MRVPRKAIIVFLFLTVVLLSSWPFWAFTSVRAAQTVVPFEDVATFFREEGGNKRIEEHVKYLSELGSRVTGYPGFFKAAEYIVNQLEDMGVKPFGGDGGFYEYYDITVPFDHGANITLEDGLVLNVSMCWPNYVNTNSYISPPEGDRLVYINGTGIDAFNGKDISGKFVLMDFNSKWFYRFALMYGAKGIIYTLGTETSRGEAFSKLYYLPVKFPRYLLNYADSVKMIDYLKEKGGEATIWIKSKMTWERIPVPNIVGLIEGSDPNLKNEYIILNAYFDSISIFPKVSPGATDSLGTSVLLEIARFLTEYPLKRSVIILFTSGHFQSVWGAREYVDRHFDEIGTKLKLFISLDLSYGSDQACIVNKGFTYGYRLLESLNAKYTPLIVKIFHVYLEGLRKVFGADYGVSFIDGIVMTHPSFIQSSPPMRFGASQFDSEPFTLAAFGGGLCINTANDVRMYEQTPLDTYDRVLFSNVWSQAYFAAGIAYALTNEPTLPLAASRASRFHTEWGYTTLNITVATYNLTTNFFQQFTKERNPEVWKDLVVHYIGGSTGMVGNVIMATPTGTEGSVGVAQLAGIIEVFAKPDENGIVTIKGLKPYTGQDAISMVDVYAVNSTDGTIYGATDMGQFGAGRVGGNTVVITSSSVNKIVPIFECGSIVLLNMLNPRDLTPTLTPVVYNAFSHGPMIYWGQWSGSPLFGDRMFFVEIGTPAEIVLYLSGASAPGAGPSPGQLQAVGGVGATQYVWCALTNFSSEGTRALGYVVDKKGEQLMFKYPSYEYSWQLFRLNDERVKTAMTYSVSNPMIILYHGMAKDYLDKALIALENNKYSAAYGLSYAAWAFEQRAYSETLGLIQNAIFTTAFFFLLVLPFSYVLERLLFSYFGLKRIAAIMLISAFMVIFLYFFHPGFHLANNLLMVLAGLGIITVIMPILWFLVDEANTSAKALSARILGIHSLQSATGAIASTAFSLGIQWMRKRPFRSSLTLTSVTIIVVSLMTFTSFAAIAVPRTLSTSNTPVAYDGIIIRQKPWTNIPTEMWLQLKEEMADYAYVAPRAWYYPPAGPNTKGFIYWNTKNLTARIYGFLALSSEEQKISGIWDRIKVRGRWFYPGETYSIILSTYLATNLTRELGYTVAPGVSIPIWGVNLTVVGLFDGDALYSGSGFGPESGLIDLDGEPITPRDPTTPTGTAGVVPPHLSGHSIAIVPFDLLWTIFGSTFQPMSIAVKPKNTSDINSIAMNLAYRLNVLIIYGIIKGQSMEGWPIGDIVEITTRTWFSFLGSQNLLIPIVIAAFSILNITVGTIYERIKSISVYVVVGSTPTQIAGMFMAESLVYGLLSSVLGYVLGVVATSILIKLGFYPPEFFPNYASSFIIVVMAIALLVPLLSTIYPALKAWRLVTPSLERKWKIPKPIGDRWTIPLPFVVTTKEELYGFFSFLKEFLQAYSGAEKTGLFSTETLVFAEYMEAGKDIKRLSAEIRLAPYDLGLMEEMDMVAAAGKGKSYSIVLQFLRTGGVRKNWETSNKVFIDTLRKQFLIWRTLPPSEKESYQKKALESLKEIRK